MDQQTPRPLILVVDDDALLRLHASDLLEDAGYRVVEATDSASALTILEERPDVRLLFTDVQMPPGCDGLDLAQQVRERWPRVLLLVTSGGATLCNDDIPGDGRFLPKPYDRDMVDQVGRLIATHPDKG